MIQTWSQFSNVDVKKVLMTTENEISSPEDVVTFILLTSKLSRKNTKTFYLG